MTSASKGVGHGGSGGNEWEKITSSKPAKSTQPTEQQGKTKKTKVKSSDTKVAEIKKNAFANQAAETDRPADQFSSFFGAFGSDNTNLQSNLPSSISSATSFNDTSDEQVETGKAAGHGLVYEDIALDKLFEKLDTLTESYSKLAKLAMQEVEAAKTALKAIRTEYTKAENIQSNINQTNQAISRDGDK